MKKGGMDDFLKKDNKSMDNLKKKYFEQPPDVPYKSKAQQQAFEKREDLEEYIQY